jgi:hypothetical protein
MKSINCGNIRREIEMAGSARRFSNVVISHIRDCAACADISRRQNNLHSLVSNLATVEAPGDFDFRLRARLAEVDQKRTSTFSLTRFSPGLRWAAVMAMLLVVAAVILVNFKSGSDNLPVAVKLPVSQPTTPDSRVTPTTAPVQAVAQSPKTNDDDALTPKTGYPVPRSKRRAVNSEVATARSSRSASRDFSSTSAGVVRPFDQVAGSYPTEAFPINASYQPLKVSVDNGSGSPRTISLPSVSFGSQRALSQSATPLVASARGTW